MALAIVQIKIMPESPNTDLDKIEKKALDLIKKGGSTQTKTEKEPIAFGLVALKIIFTWEESKSSDELISSIQDISDVSSVEIIDFRRAIG